MQSLNERSLSNREILLHRIKGQILRVPDVLACFPDWKVNLNPAYQAVKAHTEQWREELVKNGVSKTFVKASVDFDSALLAAVFWATASEEHLKIFSEYQAWFFLFDDEFDRGGMLHEDDEKATSESKQIIDLINACLGATPNYQLPDDSTVSMAVIYRIIMAYRACMNDVSRELLRQSVVEYVEGVVNARLVRTNAQLPSAETHLKMRRDDIGVLPLITPFPFAYGVEISADIWNLESWQAIVKETKDLIVLTNDMLSVEKEVRIGQVENVVTLYVHQYNVDLDVATAKVFDLMRSGYNNFTAAEGRLRQHPLFDHTVEVYVEGCKALVTGNAYWSYNCRRYFKADQRILEGNEVVFQF